MCIDLVRIEAIGDLEDFEYIRSYKVNLDLSRLMLTVLYLFNTQVLLIK